MTDKIHIPEVLPPAKPPGPPVSGIEVQAAPHPFKAARIHKVVAEGMTLEEILRDVQPDSVLRAHAHILLDDLPIPRDQWDKVRPVHGQNVIVRIVPQGGKNPFRILLQIAVVAIAFVAAPYLGAALGAQLGLGTLGTGLITSAISGAILAGGTALINAIAPIRPPSGHEDNTDSPNYFIDQARNQARPFAPVPSLLGRHRIVPPLGAQTYTEVVGDHQYLRMLVVWGYGPIEITNMRIGETPITNYENVDVEHFVGREGEIGKLYRVRNNMLEFVEDTSTEPTLYPQDVIEEQVAVELRHMREQAGGRTPNKNDPDGGIWVQRTTAAETDEISIDLTFPRGIIEFSSKGEKETMEIRVQIAYRKVGDATWLAPTLKDSRGNTAPRAATNFSGLSIDQPDLPSKPANERQPDAAGETPLTFIEKTTEAVRRGAAWATPERAQYEVRVRRISQHDISPEDFDEVHWTALRSFTNRYPVQFAHPLCMTALKIQGTNQLNGAVDTLNGEGGAFIQDWNGTDWEEAISSNPASIFRHILQGPARGTPTPTHQIDLDALQAWHDYCRMNGFEYNAIRDFRGSVFDALSDVAAAGQASPHYRDGKWTVVVDTGDQEPVQGFSPRNASGFSAQRHFQDVPHALRVRFSNRDEGWRRDERIVYNDGYTADNAEHFITLDAPGITDPDHIWKWGRFHLAQIILRRETWTFDSDFEYLVAGRGDRITLSYDTLLVGQQPARILSLRKDTNGNILEALLDERVSMRAGLNYGVAIRGIVNRNLVHTVENMASPANPTVQTNGLIFTTPISAAEGVEEDTLVFFGRAGLETIDALISEIKPGPDITARITCLPFQAPGLYNAATQPIPPYVTGLTPLPGNPVMEIRNVRSDESTLGREGDFLVPRILVEVVPTDNEAVVGIEAQIRDANSREPYHNAIIEGQTPASVFIKDVAEGETYDLRLRWQLPPDDFRFSQWAEVRGHLVVGKGTNPPPLANMALSSWADNTVLLRWDPIRLLDVRYGGEIRFRHSGNTVNRSWENAIAIGQVIEGRQNYAILPAKAGVYLARVFDAAENASPVRFVVANAPTLLAYESIETLMESTTFPGVKTNVFVSNNALIFDAAALDGTYAFSRTVDLNTAQHVRCTSIIGVEGTALTNAWVEVRTTQDDPASTTAEWTAWQRLDTEQLMARGFQFRLRMTRPDAMNALRVTLLGAAIDQPRVSNLSWLDQWVTNFRYVVDNIVFNDDRSWICTGDHLSAAGNEPTIENMGGEFWSLLANKGRDIDGRGWELQGPWVVGQEYRLTNTLQDLVAHMGRTYACLVTHTSTEENAPGTTGGGTFWELLADRGSDGNTWLTGSGEPDDSIGKNGDFYLDADTALVYEKVDEAWVQRANLHGADGASWHTGTEVPSSDLGENGDYYFRTSDATIWQKGGGSWTSLLDIGQGRWLSGSAAPATGLGAVGDFYFQFSNGYVHEKTLSGWVFRRDITGPQGDKGDTGDRGPPGPPGVQGPAGTPVDVDTAVGAALTGTGASVAIAPQGISSGYAVLFLGNCSFRITGAKDDTSVTLQLQRNGVNFGTVNYSLASLTAAGGREITGGGQTVNTNTEAQAILDNSTGTVEGTLSNQAISSASGGTYTSRISKTGSGTLTVLRNNIMVIATPT